jgi:hypothetical protein
MIDGSFTSVWDGAPSDPNMTHIPGTWLAQGLWDRLGISVDRSIALHAYGDSSQQGDPGAPRCERSACWANRQRWIFSTLTSGPD